MKIYKITEASDYLGVSINNPNLEEAEAASLYRQLVPKASVVMWLSGVVFSAAAIIIAVLLFAINRIAPASAPQPQPIVIQMPSATLPPAPLPSK